MSTNNNVRDAYFAGLFDGEGCLVIAPAGRKHKDGKRKLAIRCIITNNNKDVLLLAKEYFGGTVLFKDSWRKTGYKNSYQWYACTANAMRFLHKIHPYSVIKKPKIDVAFEFEATLLPPHNGPRGLSPELLRGRELLKLKMARA